MVKVTINGETKRVKRKLFLMVDTETFSEIPNDFQHPICYDVGLAVIDKMGNVYAQYSFVVADTFLGMAEKAATAYYADKFPQYHKDIREGKRKVCTFETIQKVANALLEKWHITDVAAHNAKFDCTSLNYTTKFLGIGNSFFLQYVEWWDTLQMVYDTIYQQKFYQDFCRENGYMTRHKNPKCQMKAEVIYKFMIHDNNFVESHTGLEDVLIEKEILARCYRTKKKMRHHFFVSYDRG